MAGVEPRNPSRTYVVSIVLAGASMMALSAQAQTVPDGPALLGELMKQRASLPPHALSTETQANWESGQQGGGELCICQTRQDGTRIDVIMDQYGIDGETRVPRGTTRIIWDGQQYIARWKLNTLSGEETPLQAGFASNKARAEQVISSPFNGGFLAGYLDSGVHICDQLKKASGVLVRPERENAKGHACYVLTADAEGTHYTLWIDPNNGFTIRQAVIERIHPIAGPITTRLDDVEIRKVNDRWIPVAGMYAVTATKSRQTFKSRRTNIALNPDFEAMQAFRMDQIPNGTRVINLDAPRVYYMWKDGKVVTGAEE
jgi:hypothetical protein